MRPLQITREALVVYDDFADLVGPALGKWLEQARRDRREIHPDHVEAIERLHTHGRGVPIPELKSSESWRLRFRGCRVEDSEADHELTGLCERAIVKRCRAGTLTAEQPGGPGTAWRIDAASLPKEDLCTTR